MHSQTNRDEDQTWQAHRNALFRFILSRVRNEAISEDIVQEVLIKAYTQLGKLKEPSKLRAWLYQITRNEISNYYRSQKPWETVRDVVVQTDSQEVNSAQWELAQCLVPLLHEVPEPYREALKLADLEDKKQHEIASLLGISLSGAKSRVQRGRKMLRDVLLKCCQVELDRRGRLVDYEGGDGCGECGDRSEPSETQVNARTGSRTAPSDR